MEDIILQYTYPRIDAEVSKHRNHLLKAPFCVHPGTGELPRSSALLNHDTSYPSPALVASVFGPPRPRALWGFYPFANIVGRVCVPVNPSLVDEFDPDTVPTVGDLLNELDRVPPPDEDSVKGRRVEGELDIFCCAACLARARRETAPTDLKIMTIPRSSHMSRCSRSTLRVYCAIVGEPRGVSL